MEKRTYESGMWSERDGQKLTWGKGDKTQLAVFGACDKIDEVPSGYHAMIRKAGQTPENFCSVASAIAAKILIPEIEACITFARQKQTEEKVSHQTELDTAIGSGTAFRTAEIAEQYGGTLTWARRLTESEKSEYAEWFRDLCMVSFAGFEQIEVDPEAIRQIVSERHPNGQFLGCTNHAWTITSVEWDRIVALDVEINAQKSQAQTKFEVAEAADIQRKITTGYCFYCETWCHGDCGHYSNDPDIQLRRDLDQAQKEMNYGIND